MHAVKVWPSDAGEYPWLTEVCWWELKSQNNGVQLRKNYILFTYACYSVTSTNKFETLQISQIFEDCGVTGITAAEDSLGIRRIKSVETDLGKIRTRTIVNCAGVWAPYIGEVRGGACRWLCRRNLKPGYWLLIQQSFSFQSFWRSVFDAVVNDVVHGLFFCTTGTCCGIAKTPPRHECIAFTYASA